MAMIKSLVLWVSFFIFLIIIGLLSISEEKFPARFSGTFLQLRFDQEQWQSQEWALLFSYFKRLGISKLVVQWSLYDDIAFYPTDNYRTVKNPPLETIMKLADAADIKVLLGLAHDPGYWDNIRRDPEWVKIYLRQRMQQSISVAEQLKPLVSQHTSFEGWYITEEIDDINWRGPAARQLITSYLDKLSANLHKITNNKEVAVSCFTNAAVDPETFKEFWKSLLQPTSIDIILFQDGIGVRKLDLQSLPLYLEAMQQAARVNSRDLYVVTEVFQQVSGPPINDFSFRAIAADFERVKEQMEIASNYSQHIIAFNIPDYMIPEASTSSRRLFKEYLNYLEEQKE